MSDGLERIEKVALRQGEAVFSAIGPRGRHGHVIWLLDKCGIRIPEAEQGFITSAGRFVDRIEGLEIAKEAGQIVQKTGGPNELYSEDMW